MFRNKIAVLLGAAGIYLAVCVTPAVAGSIGIGISGIGILAETDGSETLKTTSVVTKKAGVNGTGLVASGYVQYTFGDHGFVIGVEKIPGTTSLGSSTLSRTDWVGGNTTTGNSVQQDVRASIGDHFGGYIETPSFGGFFAKVGYSEMTLTTQETLGTGASYGDDTLNGTTVGLGFRGTSESGIHVKFAVERTDYDTVSLVSSGSDAESTISGDIMTYGARVSVGYNF